MPDTPTRDQIVTGSRVLMETKKNQKSGRLTEGVVSEILTSSSTHPHGIKVRLVDGQVGRVKRILSGKTSPSPTSKHLPNLETIEIPKTEDKYNEFKEFFQYDKAIVQLGNNLDKSKAIDRIKHGAQERFAQAVCSFANDYSGGIIFLGIRADGTVSGLDPDMRLQSMTNYNDEFANHMRTVLEKFLGDRVFLTSKIRLKFREIEGKTICVVQVLPSDAPLYLKGEKQDAFFVRGFAPRAEKLDGAAQVRYIKKRFPNFE